MNKEFKENTMATAVDVLSMMVAYSLGLRNEGFLFGLGYAGFDAWLVIWQRKRITRFLTYIQSKLCGTSSPDTGSTLYVGSLVWEKE